jgi:hypothetical protein
MDRKQNRSRAMLTEPIAVTLLVVDTLEDLGVPYFIGGSLATAVHGVARATMDVDIVADLRVEQAASLVDALGDAFYADLAMIRGAILRQGSFNLIHLKTMFKVDVFVRGRQPFDQTQFRRRQVNTLAQDPARTAYVASPEDNILAKLVWFRKGGEVSDRQWQDIVNVLLIQGDRLDLSYLREWAARLGVTDLLKRALGAVDIE